MFHLPCGLAFLLFALPGLPTLAAPPDVPSAASFYVPSLPDLHQDSIHPLRIYAGHLSSDPTVPKSPTKDLTAHLYFVMIKNRRVADKQRLMFWFNGGPGCSSFDGLMMEVGPWRMDGKGGFKVVDGGWEEYTTMVYIDQPAGTGFSLASTDRFIHTLDQAAVQLMEFLRNFYDVFPEYKNVDTYLGGESYAGQYIPYFADAILKSPLKIPIKGAAIGNGWIDARRQYASYIDYAVKVGLLEENSEPWKQARKATDDCLAELATLKYPEPISSSKCQRLLFSVINHREHTLEGKLMCTNIYDVRYEDTKPACGMNWPPDMAPITTYLDRKDVVRALHATAHTESWTECRSAVHTAFHERESNSSITLIPKVLERIPMLIFAGDQDLICNYVGIEMMIQAMTWNGGTGLGTVKTQSWSVAGTPAGTWVSSRNLTYAKIFNASHMAPFDVPHVTHDMILRFMGVNFSAIADGTAKIPSSLGTDMKPMYIASTNGTAPPPVVTGKTPSQDKAMWEAYYNAGSAGVVLLLIIAGIGTFLWCRIRRRRSVRLPPPSTEEENIPLNASVSHHDDDPSGEHQISSRGSRNGKGKSRGGQEPLAPPVFDVGESDDEDGYKSDASGRGRTRG